MDRDVPCGNATVELKVVPIAYFEASNALFLRALSIIFCFFIRECRVKCILLLSSLHSYQNINLRSQSKLIALNLRGFSILFCSSFQGCLRPWSLTLGGTCSAAWPLLWPSRFSQATTLWLSALRRSTSPVVSLPQVLLLLTLSTSPLTFFGAEHCL